MSVTSFGYTAEIESLNASQAGDRYTVELKVLAEIPESFAREVLLDPDRVVQVNNELLAVHHLPSEQADVRRFRDHTHACVWLFCVDYENTISMRLLDNQDIQLTVEPELSAFKYGVFTWHTEPQDSQHTRLIFRAVSTPNFWVPVIGLMESRMKKGVTQMLANMECEYHQDERCLDPPPMWEDSTQID